MIKEISDFTHTSFYELLEKPAVEIAGTITLMYYKAKYNQYGNI
jgi:hypothetical protein